VSLEAAAAGVLFTIHGGARRRKSSAMPSRGRGALPLADGFRLSESSLGLRQGTARSCSSSAALQLQWLIQRYCSIKRQIAHDESLQPASSLADLQCPLQALSAWRVGPIWLGPCGEWAERHELEASAGSQRQHDHPRQGGERPMPMRSNGGWRALTEGEARACIFGLMGHQPSQNAAPISTQVEASPQELKAMKRTMKPAA